MLDVWHKRRRLRTVLEECAWTLGVLGVFVVITVAAHVNSRHVRKWNDQTLRNVQTLVMRAANDAEMAESAIEAASRDNAVLHANAALARVESARHLIDNDDALLSRLRGSDASQLVSYLHALHSRALSAREERRGAQ